MGLQRANNAESGARGASETGGDQLMAKDPDLADSSSSIGGGLRVVVAGCGITGLATAHSLLQQNRVKIATIDLIDPRSRPGGVIESFRSGGFTLEAAAQGVLASREAFSALVDELNLERSLLATPPGLRRYLIRGNRAIAIRPLPFAWVMSGLLSLRGLMSFLLEPFRPRSLKAVHETLVEFCSRRFGSEWAHNFMVPLATGIWAGGAGRILARHALPRLVEWELKTGSVVRGALAAAIRTAWSRPRKTRRKGLLTFETGMGFLPEELARHIARLADETGTLLKFHYSESIQSAHREPDASAQKLANFDRPWRIETNRGKRLEADLFFNTTPPWSSTIAWNWGAFGEERWASIAAQPTHSVAVVGLGGHDTQNPAHGFGALAGEDSSGLLGVLYVHSIAPRHAPSGHFLYRLMLGGDRCPEMATWTEERCISRARTELIRLGLVSPSATFTFEKVFRWQNAIPLADSGQDARLQALGELETASGGLFFAGNYLKGVGVDDCLVSAQEAVQRAVHYAQRQTVAAPDTSRSGP